MTRLVTLNATVAVISLREALNVAPRRRYLDSARPLRNQSGGVMFQPSS